MANKLQLDSRIQRGFLLAMAYNLNIILFSRGFSDNLGNVDPLFDSAGCKCIFLWALAYGALADRYHLVPAVSAVFAVEKLFYGHRWLVWIMDHHHQVDGMIEQDMFTGIFFALYGVGDLLSMILFAYAAWISRDNLFEVKSIKVN